ncbi:patatin-like phospholipase domain-containing protein [Annulohypoxylon maeteangense]|uniref:patatin-like phospholipase domain-containing protein n=1 Tax=Annulohypoxylon maeteangense TaxID=1927788 RepID=UPI002007AEA5|nr:patatin-like phospholipase domain-containing protein [Annulohypoxylon maeteangense]KAI0883412.1 patatin-like phospholipase domain-containing protein [Annulohypoxylon maeteangense]
MASESSKPRVTFLPGRRNHNYGFPPEAFDYTRLPDVDREFLPPEHLAAFASALNAPDPSNQSSNDTTSLLSPTRSINSLDITRSGSVASVDSPYPESAATQNGTQGSMFITAQNDWAPVNQKVTKHGRKKRRKKTALGRRTVDETREGHLYGLLKWPFLLFVGMWIIGLGASYLWTRFYIFLYEHFIAWRGARERLRRNMRATSSYRDWVKAAKEMDAFLGNQAWKEENEYAYYDSKTVRRVWEQLRKHRRTAEAQEAKGSGAHGYENGGAEGRKAVEELKALTEACVKNNFVGVENPRLYSQTYYGTKNLVQNFIDEVEKSTRFLAHTDQISFEEKRALFKRMHANYGRTALCLSGGAVFAYYHFGVVKALLEADLVPDVITGTSGGALVASLVATRTNDELKQLLIPALAHKIKACSEPISTWFPRWWKTGARFDSVDWARQGSWWSRGSMTFREAYQRTGRILNVSCVPADPHSPTILCNYLTSPDCVIWSAVLASAAVPGIQNPVVLMMKTRDGNLVPYSFGHKWKDGSLRTDIPIKALNLHFNVNFTIVSQVNPHISLFFFSSRGTVGSPVTHRKGRGWRGGYLGSATEQYIKLDLTKWLKVLRHLELLPRPLGQDWSQLWLQQFSGTITIWPQAKPSDFWNILSDPDPDRLARMIHEGQQSAFPRMKFVANRLKVERLIEMGRRETLGGGVRRGSIESIIDREDLESLLRGSGGSTDGETTEADADGEEYVGVDEEAVEDGEFEERFGDGEEEVGDVKED